MKTFDLENFKDAWRNEASFGGENLTDQKITAYLTASTNDLYSFFRKGLLFDIIFKLGLFTVIPVLTYIYPGHGILNVIDILSIFIILTSIGWQIFVLKELPDRHESEFKVADTLQRYLHYFYKYYLLSVYVMALSAVLFFVIGSNHYFLIKYNQLPAFDAEDIMVLSAGILLSFGLSIISHHTFSKFRIGQAEQTLEDIRENDIDDLSISNDITRRKQWTRFFSLAIIVGIIILIILLLKI